MYLSIPARRALAERIDNIWELFARTSRRSCWCSRYSSRKHRDSFFRQLAVLLQGASIILDNSTDALARDAMPREQLNTSSKCNSVSKGLRETGSPTDYRNDYITEPNCPLLGFLITYHRMMWLSASSVSKAFVAGSKRLQETNSKVVLPPAAY